MTVLVVDTSAWRGRGDAWFEGQRDRGRGLAIADQGARELVRQAIEEPAEFSQARAACRRAARFTTVRLPPIELHLLTALGVVQTLPDPPDPRRLCALVARSASHRDLLYNVSRDIPIGSGMSFSAAASLKSMREEKLEWLRDWEELLEQIAPGSMRPKSTRPPLKIEAMEYAKRRAALRRDRIGLVQ